MDLFWKVMSLRIISLDTIKGNEMLAKDIINKDNVILISAGSVIKKEYVKRLKDLGISYIYAEDELSKGVNLTNSLEFQIKEQCLASVKDILIKYSYYDSFKLEEIKLIADDIIQDIMSEPKMIYNLSSIREKSESTYSHSLNVCALGVMLAFKLRLPKQKIKDIAVGCLLHDIGLTYLTIDYKNIELSEFSDSDKNEIMKHTIYGYSAVEKMKWLSSSAKEIILAHHERIDGSGYPFHRKEDHIKIGAKIAAVCDEFDSKVYGNLTKKMRVHEVIDYIVSQAGVLFDFSVVRAFVNSVAAYPTGTLVMTNTEEMAIVLRQNPQYPTRPVIRVIKDKDGNQLIDWLEKDLTKELTLFITDTIIE